MATAGIVEACLGRGQDRGDMPWPQPGPWGHALARAGAVETCLGQRRTRGDMPGPEPGPWGHALATAGTVKTCLGHSRDCGDVPWPQPGPWRHALARAGALETCLGQGRTIGDMPWPGPGHRGMIEEIGIRIIEKLIGTILDYYPYPYLCYIHLAMRRCHLGSSSTRRVKPRSWVEE